MGTARALAPAAVFAAALAAYLATLCPSVYAEGSGELIGATYLLGTPHPTGYPLYCLLGRSLCALIPSGSPAYQVNAATAILAAGGAAALCLLLMRLGVGAESGFAAGLALAFGHTYWSQAVIAEVYGLMALASCLVLVTCLRARTGPDRGRWLLLAGYASGLGITCHLQVLLLAAVAGAVAVWGTGRARPRGGRLAADAARFLAGAAVGASVLVYLPVRNGMGPAFHWGELDTAAALWDHVTGELYRSSFYAAPARALPASAWRFAGQLMGEWTLWLAPIAAWGLPAAWRRDRSLVAILGGASGLNLVTALAYHRNPAGRGVFFLLSILCAAVLLGHGLDDLSRRLRARFGGGSRPGALAPSLLAAVAVVAVAVANAGGSDRSRAWLPDRFGRQLLAELPEGAAVLTEGDDASYIVDYLHRVEGVRPDVDLYNRTGRGTDLARHAPARERQRWRLAREVELITSGRPVHFLAARVMPVAGYRFAPQGLSYRAVPESASAEPVLARPEVLLEGVTRIPDPWVDKLAADAWFMAAEGRRAAGQPQAAEEAYLRAAAAAPTSQSTSYNVALIFLQLNRLDLSKEYAMRAVQIDPSRRGPYRLAAEILSRLGDSQALQNLHERAAKWARLP